MASDLQIHLAWELFQHRRRSEWVVLSVIGLSGSMRG